MNDLWLFGLIGVALVSIVFLGVVNVNALDSKLSLMSTSFKDRMINLENGLNYLYASETNLTTSFSDRDGLYPSASYTNELNTMIINTENKSNNSICLLFLHELGHKVCYPDLSESCANDFREKNLFRCEELE